MEEQFYFLIPLLLFFIPKRWVAAAIGLALLALAPLSRDPLGLLWFVRVDAILVGMAIGWTTHVLERRGQRATPPAWLRRKWLIQLLVLGVLLAIGWLGAGERGGRPGTITAIAVCSGLLVWIASHDQDVLIPSNRIARAFFVWMGNRSYCLYLVHMVAYFLTIELWFRAGGVQGPWQQLAYFATAAVLVPAFAEITARWVETPLRRKGHARAQPWLARPDSQPDQTLHA